MNSFEYDVSLRIRHPEISSEEICSKLGLQAFRKWTKGEPRKTPKGMILKGINRETYCSFRLVPSKDIGLAEFLKECNERLYSNKKFFEEIILTGGEIEYFIGWYSNRNSGEEFELDLLAQLVDLKISLSLDFYGANDSESGREKTLPGTKKKQL